MSEVVYEPKKTDVVPQHSQQAVTSETATTLSETSHGACQLSSSQATRESPSHSTKPNPVGVSSIRGPSPSDHVMLSAVSLTHNASQAQPASTFRPVNGKEVTGTVSGAPMATRQCPVRDPIYVKNTFLATAEPPVLPADDDDFRARTESCDAVLEGHRVHKLSFMYPRTVLEAYAELEEEDMDLEPPDDETSLTTATTTLETGQSTVKTSGTPVSLNDASATPSALLPNVQSFAPVQPVVAEGQSAGATTLVSSLTDPHRLDGRLLPAAAPVDMESAELRSNQGGDSFLVPTPEDRPPSLDATTTSLTSSPVLEQLFGLKSVALRESTDHSPLVSTSVLQAGGGQMVPPPPPPPPPASHQTGALHPMAAAMARTVPSSMEAAAASSHVDLTPENPLRQDQGRRGATRAAVVTTPGVAAAVKPHERQFGKTVSAKQRGGKSPRGRGQQQHQQQQLGRDLLQPSEKKEQRTDNNADNDDTGGETTIMLRNIPNKYTQKMLLDVINEDFRGLYNFFYLPIDFRNKCNVGYAFINFIHAHYAQMFKNQFDGLKLGAFKSNKVCEVSWGRVQGLQANIEHYRNSAVMSIPNPEYKPILFRNGVPIPFPTSDGPLPSVKLRPQKC